MNKHISRRHFLATSGAALLAPMSLALVSARVQAAELPHLDEADATAAALGYRHDSTKVVAAKYPAHKPTQLCSGCTLVQGAATDVWRGCGIFPGKSVNTKGWCAAFAAKP
ncbi:MAG: high-potential iron-sulfur protein [Pseudomonadota bacterium]|nr:high-potential iron-sulfur protein [Pseudomonadota bacterium]